MYDRAEMSCESVTYRITHLFTFCLYLLAGGFNLLLTSQEDQNVAWLLIDMNLNDSSDSSFQVVPLWLLRVEDFYRVQSTRHLHEWGIQKVALEFLSF